MAKEQDTEIEYKAIDLRLIKRLLVYLKPYLKWVIVAIVLTIVISAIAPLRPLLVKIGVDNYIAKSDKSGLLKMIIVIFGFMALHGLLQFALTYLMQWIGQKVLYDIRIKLFDHIQSMSFKFYDKTPVGRLVTRVTNDVEVLNEMFSSGVVMIIADVLLIFWIIGFMFYTNWTLSLYLLTIMPFLLIATSIFRKKVRIVFRDIRLNVAKMNSFINEFISGISTIKLFNQEKNQKSAFDKVNLENRDLWIRTIFYHALFFPTIEMISTISLVIILWYTGANVFSGIMTVGTLIAFLQYAEMFFRPIRDLTEKYTTMQSAMASSERIFGLLDTQAFLPDNPGAVDFGNFNNSLEFKNVSFSYDDSKQVLKNVSFKVNKGETVAIVGATGAGKTSIINLLCRFYDYQDGEILIDGIDIRNIKQESLRKKMALVMQDVFLFSRNISDNISLGKEEILHDDVRHAAMAIGIGDFIESLPETYSTSVQERGSNFSSGQKQLISFSRAFASNPEILILDEATSNIDSQTEQLIEHSLERLMNGRTSVVIAHRLSTIKRADRIIVLHHGEVRETGTHKELLEKNGLYARIYRMQFNGQNGRN